MKFIAITNRPKEAYALEQCLIDRIMVDLEVLGKAGRQKGRSTWISDHRPEDITAVRSVLRRSSLLVRINPLNAGSRAEIDDVIGRGADLVMLPMAHTVEDVQKFVDHVGARRTTCLLLETADALAAAEEIARLPGLDEIHVGLNDLHLMLRMACMFEILSEGRLDKLAKTVASAGKKLGIGGIGVLGTGEIDPSLILREHVRLGSSRVILSRSFFAGVNREGGPEEIATVAPRVARLREYIESLRALTEEDLTNNRLNLKINVDRFLAGDDSSRA